VTLFAGAETYAPGEPGQQGMGQSAGQNVNWLARYHLGNLQGPNLVIALVGLLALAYAAHRWLK
jgi:hypothetical protein